MILQENGIHRKAGVVTSNKTDFKINKVTRHKNGHFIMIRGHYVEDISLLNICTQSGSTKIQRWAKVGLEL